MINPISYQPERSALNITMKLTAWICIVSTGLLGCASTTTLIQPEGENQEKLHSGEIESVVMKDGTKYEFEGTQKGTVVAGMVRGISGGKTVAIPLTDVDKVLVRESNSGLTIILAVVGGVTFVALLVAASGGFRLFNGGSFGSGGK
jgi:hypothetical protein